MTKIISHKNKSI
uniref:Uncharacterized protein n=1 Tax=Arundo donax TaxID=35708 RepID=A0A0A8ZWD3_ARUDO